MINEIRASGVACRSTRQNQDRDKVAQRFGIIVLTDCLCWVPVILVKVVALSGKFSTFCSVKEIFPSCLQVNQYIKISTHGWQYLFCQLIQH